jgi:lantibiotic leader peptide-processing serine protease
MTSRRLLSGLATVGLLTAVGCVDEPRTPAGPATPGRAPQFSVTTGADGGPGATGRHIVSFTGAVPSDFAAQVALLGGTVEWVSPGSGLATVSGLSSSGATALAGLHGVATVDADEGIALDIPAVSDAEAADGAGVTSPTAPASAFRYARQWNMRVVRADAAWAHGFLGSPDVSIFMLDTGIDYLHADLMGRVDLTRSVDLLGTFRVRVIVGKDTLIVRFTERDTVAKYFPTRLAFTDLFFHGTHTGATVSSNAVRAAGITSMTRLVAVKVCAYLNICPFSSILRGVLYAADNGADVINLSLGGGFVKAGNGRFVGLINRTFNFARSKGVTIVVSAGNAAADLDHIGNVYAVFCDTPAVICVSATGPTANASVNGPWTNVDAPAFYTNFGRSAINVAAPGGNSSFGPPLPQPASRNTFVWAACSQTSLLIKACAAAPIFILGLEGTSMSAPHVSGTAALLVSLVGRNPAQIKARIQQSADNVAGNGTTPFYGKGRLNVARAVGAIP